mmetsp:Transcript_26355/g.52953  ORF Transcript_26355/g.52953 Transcript_26355/m.52953 type:complete len:337 (+) Transcript_26355:203-1213(+)
MKRSPLQFLGSGRISSRTPTRRRRKSLCRKPRPRIKTRAKRARGSGRARERRPRRPKRLASATTTPPTGKRQSQMRCLRRGAGEGSRCLLPPRECALFSRAGAVAWCLLGLPLEELCPCPLSSRCLAQPPLPPLLLLLPARFRPKPPLWSEQARGGVRRLLPPLLPPRLPAWLPLLPPRQVAGRRPRHRHRRLRRRCCPQVLSARWRQAAEAVGGKSPLRPPPRRLLRPSLPTKAPLPWRRRAPPPLPFPRRPHPRRRRLRCPQAPPPALWRGETRGPGAPPPSSTKPNRRRLPCCRPFPSKNSRRPRNHRECCRPPRSSPLRHPLTVGNTPKPRR